MSDLSSMTKADLLETIGALRAQINDLSKTVAAPASPPRVPEADAIAACIRALDPLESDRSNSMMYQQPVVAARSRVIKHLAVKYGIELVKVETLPCDRPHADQIDPAAIGYAVQQAMTGGIR